MLTARGWAVLGSGVVLYALARGFGATVLAVLGVAFVLLPVLALVLCRRYRRGPLALTVEPRPRRPVEGGAWSCAIAVTGRLPRGALLELPLLGVRHAVPLRRADGAFRGAAEGVVERRGRYRAQPGRIRVADPLGLAALERPVEGGEDLIVWLDPSAASAEAGSGPGGDGRRQAARVRTVGFDLHGIREHRPGESLRRVDWKTSARTGALMVRELEDASRVDVLVIVDPGSRAAAAPPAELDALLRAAAALARSLSRSDLEAVLAVEGARRERVPLDGTAAAWGAAMDALSAAEADRDGPLAERLERCRDARAAASIVLVTATPDARLAAWAGRAAERCAVEVLGVAPDDPRWPRPERARAGVAGGSVA